MDRTKTTTDDILHFVMDERARCVSDREWRHRLRGYGYDIVTTGAGAMLTKLPHGREICPLDI
ncbi:hypothetical protein [Histidinibacterium aquaticum]|uniref:Uncharacterized protein n=1 Tax=Histidinibacterium aquaticum TaxID=2613962 RepID=A0A5J5GM27_9RHOB|nr:hypothetical protein [Histidinibacterium aquaticum]KAA9009097.1 hypothetical protein F3S47_07530 [Histidinibacterium aquaticum]